MSRSKGDLNPKVLTILALVEQNSPLIVIAIHVIHKLNCWILMLHCCYLTKHRNTQRKKIYRAQFYFKRFKPYIVITKLETPHCPPFSLLLSRRWTRFSGNRTKTSAMTPISHWQPTYNNFYSHVPNWKTQPQRDFFYFLQHRARGLDNNCLLSFLLLEISILQKPGHRPWCPLYISPRQPTGELHIGHLEWKSDFWCIGLILYNWPTSW